MQKDHTLVKSKPINRRSPVRKAARAAVQPAAHVHRLVAALALDGAIARDRQGNLLFLCQFPGCGQTARFALAPTADDPEPPDNIEIVAGIFLGDNTVPVRFNAGKVNGLKC